MSHVVSVGYALLAPIPNTPQRWGRVSTNTPARPPVSNTAQRWGRVSTNTPARPPVPSTPQRWGRVSTNTPSPSFQPPSFQPRPQHWGRVSTTAPACSPVPHAPQRWGRVFTAPRLVPHSGTWPQHRLTGQPLYSRQLRGKLQGPFSTHTAPGAWRTA